MAKKKKTGKQKAAERHAYYREAEERVTRRSEEKNKQHLQDIADGKGKRGKGDDTRRSAPVEDSGPMKRARSGSLSGESDVSMEAPGPQTDKAARREEYLRKKALKHDRTRAGKLAKLDIPYSEGSRYAGGRPTLQAPPAKRRPESNPRMAETEFAL